MYFDGSFTLNGARGGVVLISPKGDRLLYVIQLHFRASNNVVEHKAQDSGLRITTKLRVQWLYICGNSKLNVNQVMGESNCHDSRMTMYRLEEKFDGFEQRLWASRFHQEVWPGRLSDKVFSGRPWPVMQHRSYDHVGDASILLDRFTSQPKSSRRSPLPGPSSCGGLDLLGPFKKAPGALPTCSSRSISLLSGSRRKPWLKSAPSKSWISSRTSFLFWVPNYIITYNGTQFTEEKFLDFCYHNNICVDWAAVFHPRINGQVERANGMILQGLKPRILT
jgi:ribonuclease HI